jgi:two-component system, cell cycle response regulator DivK
MGMKNFPRPEKHPTDWRAWEGREMTSLEHWPVNPREDTATADKWVLIIEDNPLNMKLFNAIIAAQGYRVLHATDGSQGLKLAHKQHPDLIVVDVQLPDMSGLDLTRSLKADKDTCDIPIIVTTAHGLSGDAEEIQASGCDGFMAKPIAIAEFLELIALLVTRSVSAPRYID